MHRCSTVLPGLHPATHHPPFMMDSRLPAQTSPHLQRRRALRHAAATLAQPSDCSAQLSHPPLCPLPSSAKTPVPPLARSASPQSTTLCAGGGGLPSGAQPTGLRPARLKSTAAAGPPLSSQNLHTCRLSTRLLRENRVAPQSCSLSTLAFIPRTDRTAPKPRTVVDRPLSTAPSPY